MPRDIQLYADPMLPTGIATAPGDGRTPVVSADDLPPHLVELHVFHGHDLAIAFADGISLVSGHSLSAANTVATWRDGEGRMGNVVLVALLDRDRDRAAALADAVPVIEHKPSGEEGRLIARHGKESMERDRRDRLRRDEAVAPLLDVLKRAGIASRWDGNTGLLVRADAHEAKLHGSVMADVKPVGEGSLRRLLRHLRPSSRVRPPRPRLPHRRRVRGARGSP